MLQEILQNHDIAKEESDNFLECLYEFITIAVPSIDVDYDNADKCLKETIKKFDDLIAAESKDMTINAAFRQAESMTRWNNIRKRMLNLNEMYVKNSSISELLNKIISNTDYREVLKKEIEAELYETEDDKSFVGKFFDAVSRLMGLRDLMMQYQQHSLKL